MNYGAHVITSETLEIPGYAAQIEVPVQSQTYGLVSTHSPTGGAQASIASTYMTIGPGCATHPNRNSDSRTARLFMGPPPLQNILPRPFLPRNRFSTEKVVGAAVPGSFPPTASAAVAPLVFEASA